MPGEGFILPFFRDIRPSFTEFTRPDEVEVHSDEVPEDILPRQEDELNRLDYQQYDAAVDLRRRRRS
jgi:hypothetical protein